MKIKEIISEIELFAPVSYQEDYDNSGLICGSPEWEARGALLSLDCTEEVVDEAIRLGFNLVIAHHPIVFSGLKKFSGNSYVERTLVKAIKHDVALYACHTNIDNVRLGVNHKIASKLGLINTRILSPKQGLLKKLVTFVPQAQKEKLLQALFEAGAGKIGNYDSCSFSVEGTGTFRGNEESNPFLGKPNQLSREQEHRVEVIFEGWKQNAVLKALRAAHPYEEVAFDVYRMDNAYHQVGSGLIGEFEEAMKEKDFMALVKNTFKVPYIKHTPQLQKEVKTVALCGGSGRFLLKNAISAGAQAYITADFKYHEFFDADGRILLLDVGHYESEQFTPELFSEIIRKKFSTFAVRLSEITTNPVNYF